MKIPSEQKIVDTKGDVDTNCSWCTWIGAQGIGKGTETVGNQKNNQEPPESNIAVIGQDIYNSPDDLKGLAVTPTSVKTHWFKLV